MSDTPFAADFCNLPETAELWKPIEGYEGLYDVSSWGRIRSYSRTTKRLLVPEIRRPKLYQTGYFYAPLSKKSKVKWCQVHRLVAKHFISNPLNLPQVNHINFCRTDNCVSNLEWVSVAENTAHSKERNRPGAKLSVTVVRVIFQEFYTQVVPVKELALRYKVDTVTISSILLGRTWQKETKDLEHLREARRDFILGQRVAPLSIEIWKVIPNYGGRYLVSNWGRVKSIARLRDCSLHGDKEMLMTLSENRNGYLTAALTDDIKTTTHIVNRLVAQAFVSNQLGFPYVHHVNHDRKDNRAENLLWCDGSFNNANRQPFKRGASNRDKLTLEDARDIRRLHAVGNTGYKTIARQYGLHWDTVRKIVKGKLWKTA